MKRALAALLLLDASAPDGLTLREARASSPEDLAGRVLGMIGARYREVRIHEGGPFGPRGLAGISFASAPRSAGFPGLCEADEVFVSFTPITADSRNYTDPRADPPVQVHRFFRSTSYRIVGDTNRLDFTDADWELLDRACAQSGPVLAADGHLHAFRVPDDRAAHAYFGARALQKSFAAARAEQLRIDSCHEDQSSLGACADPARLLAGAVERRLTRVSVERCTGGTNLCAELVFLHASTGNTHTSMILILETDQAIHDPPTPTLDIVSASIRFWTIIED